jgi:hypothetical protein
MIYHSDPAPRNQAVNRTPYPLRAMVPSAVAPVPVTASVELNRFAVASKPGSFPRDPVD